MREEEARREKRRKGKKKEWEGRKMEVRGEKINENRRHKTVDEWRKRRQSLVYGGGNMNIE